MLRKIRIIVNDPYATDDDSSSDDKLELHILPKGKRIVYEINLSESPADRSDGVKNSRKKAPRQSKNPVGVRLRPSGKWGAEIRNPITRTTQWLGTFETPQEAEKAYADKRSEYDALASPRPYVPSTFVPVNSSCSSSLPCVNVVDLSMSKDVTNDVCFGFEISDLEIPDLSFLAADEECGNNVELDFDCCKDLVDDFMLSQ